MIGSPNDIRVALFDQALIEAGLPRVTVVSYADLINGTVNLNAVVTAGALVRIESCGKCEESNRALLALGANQPDIEGEYQRVDPRNSFAKGQIIASRQWFLGLRALMQQVTAQLATCPPHHLMNHPEDIVTMFDKRACHALLNANGVRVPRAFGEINSFDALEAAMDAHDIQRVFVKLAHGSSASGVVAYQRRGNSRRATAAIEMIKDGDALTLYNSRRVQTYSDHAEIAALIDSLCQHRVHVEQWIPKARMGDHIFDLRVVVVGGAAAHSVARLSKTPMTNLHLLNQRRDRQDAINHLGDARFAAAMKQCEMAMAQFPRSLYGGVDLLVASGLEKYYVLEVNAFGDLLHNTHYQGMNTYALEIQTARARM